MGVLRSHPCSTHWLSYIDIDESWRSFVNGLVDLLLFIARLRGGVLIDGLIVGGLALPTCSNVIDERSNDEPQPGRIPSSRRDHERRDHRAPASYFNIRL